MPDITAQFAAFPTAHAYRHPLRADGRESLAHMILMPEHGIAGFLYPAVLANGEAKGRAALIGPGIDGPIQETVDMAVPADMNFDDFHLGPLTMAVRDPHKRVDLGWNGTRIRFQGTFEALHPPYAFSMHPDGNPPYYGDDRTEQHGTLTATLEVDGKSYAHSGFLIRDHSWGPRIWGLNQHYKWFHAATAESSIHFFEMHSFGRRQLRGFLYKNGIMRHLKEVACDFTLDAQMMHQSVHATVTDTDGRTAQVTCKTFASLQLEYDPMIYLNEAALTLEIDGAPGTGWCEFCWNRNYFEFAKTFVSKYG